MNRIVLYDEERNNMMLNKFRCFSFEGSSDVTYASPEVYEASNKIISKKYLLKMVDGLSTTSIIFKMMRWLYHIIPSHKKILPQRMLGEDLLNLAIYKKYSFNCADYAIVYNDIMLSLGIPSKVVCCRSYDIQDDECHVVNHVFNFELGKWMIVDSAFCCCIGTEDNGLLDLLQLREALCDNTPLSLYYSATSKWEKSYTDRYSHYMRKNIFLFSTPRISGLSNGTYCYDHLYLISPIGYNSSKWSERDYFKTSNAAILF